MTRSRNNRMRGVHMPALESPQSIDGETLALALREAGGLPELPVARSSGTQHAMAAVCDSLRLADADARVIGCVGVIFSIAPSFPAGSKNRLFYAGIRPVLSLYFFPPILYFSIISPMPGVFQILSHTIVKGLFVETLIGATTLPSHATRDSWAVYNPGCAGHELRDTLGDLLVSLLMIVCCLFMLMSPVDLDMISTPAV